MGRTQRRHGVSGHLRHRGFEESFDKIMPPDVYGYNHCGFSFKDLQPWSVKFEDFLKAELDPVRQKHLKLLLLPIHKAMVQADLPKLVECPEGLKPDREISSDYQLSVNRLFQLGREVGISNIARAAATSRPWSGRSAAACGPNPISTSAPTDDGTAAPGSGGGIRLVRIPAANGAVACAQRDLRRLEMARPRLVRELPRRGVVAPQVPHNRQPQRHDGAGAEPLS